jgi:hypothetical protein
MWSEWLVRTLNPRRGEDAETAPRPRKPPHAAPPEHAADDFDPGADDYRPALAAVEEGE